MVSKKKAAPGGVAPPPLRTFVRFKFGKGDDFVTPVEKFIETEVEQAKTLALMRERHAIANEAAERGRVSKAATASANLLKVGNALDELLPSQRGREATALIVSKTGLSPGTVRTHLKTIRIKPKPQQRR